LPPSSGLKISKTIIVSTKNRLTDNKALRSYETPVNFYQTTQRHIPENSTFNNRGHDGLKYDMDESGISGGLL
jgi:hypothetical protein